MKDIVLAICIGAIAIIQVFVSQDIREINRQMATSNVIMQSISTSEDLILAELEGMQEVRANVTAYTLDPGETDNTPHQAAAMSKPVAGKTAAVSRDLIHMLGKKVYIPGVGVRIINDLTAEGITSTVDLLVGNKKEAAKVGREVRQVVVL